MASGARILDRAYRRPQRKEADIDETAEYPQYVVPDDAVVIREEIKVSRGGTSSVQPVYIRPAENTRKMLDEMDKARHADLWRVLVALSIRRLGPPTARTIASAFGTWMPSNMPAWTNCPKSTVLVRKLRNP